MTAPPRMLELEESTVALMVPEKSGLTATDEAFERLCIENPSLRLTRMAGGEVIVMPPAGAVSGMFNSNLSGELHIWNKANKLGYAFDSSSGFTFPNGLIHAPDSSWIVRDRFDSVPVEKPQKFPPIVPDFAAELRSPSDRIGQARKLLRSYVEQGVRLAWFLDPIRVAVEIYRPGRDVEILKRPATLSGEDVLPGFVLDLQGILFR